MRSRRRKKQDSAVKKVFLILVSIVVMICAVSVILGVYGKISRDYKNLENLKPSETVGETVSIDSDQTVGWISENGGMKYRDQDGNYAEDEWKVIDGLLYRFDEEGMLRQGQWEEDGQIFTASDKGYLKDIQQDPDYVPEETGEDLDNLVKANAFWCYLGESDGLFKPILYRKATETGIKVLGSSSFPEKTTENSLRAYGDYVYYLPKVDISHISSLSDQERKLCDTLFRVIPGSGEKEVIAEDVGGYLVLDDKIYYSQNETIYSADSGTAVPIGDLQFSVSVQNDSCYLLDGMGQPVVGDEEGKFFIGSREYQLESQGKIVSVTQNQISAGDGVYFLEQDSDGLQRIYKQKDGNREVVLSSKYGIQSFCIVNQKIYYCAYVKMEGEWYSQIFSADLSGENVQSLGGVFQGTMGTMYFYENSGEIYGEYYPKIWDQGYGQLAAVTLNGSIYIIEDQEERNGKVVSDQDRLNLVMVEGADLVCLWRDVIWSRSSGVVSTLWNQAIVLDQTKRTPIETVNLDDDSVKQETQQEMKTEKESPGSGENVVVHPVEGEQQSDAVPPSEKNGEIVPTVPLETPESGKNQAQTVGPVDDSVTIVPIG